MALTRKQQEIFDFIESYSRTHNCAPSQREIAQQFGFRSLGTVQDHLSALEARGVLQRGFYSKRNLAVVHKNRDLPLLGKVAAGKPIEYFIQGESIEVPSTMMRVAGEYFALHVSGDSMVDVGIIDGDYVVVRRQADAESGSVVVAMIEGEATIKRMHKKRGQVELHSENPKYRPIILDGRQDFRVLGVYVGLIRLH